jgi:hypothetical protein
MKKWPDNTHQADNEAADDTVPCRIRLESRSEWQIPTVDSLNLHASVETNVRDGDAKPGQETCDGRHVGKPVEHFAGTRVNAHKRQQGE